MSKSFDFNSVPAVAVKTPRDLLERSQATSLFARRTARQERRALRSL